MPQGRKLDDAWANLSEKEKEHPLFLLIQPSNLNRLDAGLTSLETHPRALDDLHDWLCEIIPDIDSFYQQNPTATRLFHVDDTLNDIRALPFGQKARVAIIQLMCLKLSEPFPPRHPHATGPTANWAKWRTKYLAQEANTIAHFSETFRSCIVPALEARSERRGLKATCEPTPSMYKAAGLLVSAEIISLAKYHKADIVHVQLGGAWAMKVADIVGQPSSLDIIPFSKYSNLFLMPVSIHYHPRVEQSSCYSTIQAYSLLRQIYTDAISFGLLGCGWRYALAAVSLGLSVPTFAEVTRRLQIDARDETEGALRLAREVVGRALKDFIRLYGNGRYGAPVRFDGGVGGGGCGKRESGEGAALQLPMITQTKDVIAMRTSLEAAGFYTDSYDNETVERQFWNSLPLLELRRSLLSFDDECLSSYALEELSDDPTETIDHLLDVVSRGADDASSARRALKEAIQALHQHEHEVDVGEDRIAPEKAIPDNHGAETPGRDVSREGTADEAARGMDEGMSGAEARQGGGDRSIERDEVEKEEAPAKPAATPLLPAPAHRNSARRAKTTLPNLPANVAVKLEGFVFRGFDVNDIASELGLSTEICEQARVYYLVSALRSTTASNYDDEDRETALELADEEVWGRLREEGDESGFSTKSYAGLD